MTDYECRMMPLYGNNGESYETFLREVIDE